MNWRKFPSSTEEGGAKRRGGAGQGNDLVEQTTPPLRGVPSLTKEGNFSHSEFIHTLIYRRYSNAIKSHQLSWATRSDGFTKGGTMRIPLATTLIIIMGLLALLGVAMYGQ